MKHVFRRPLVGFEPLVGALSRLVAIDDRLLDLVLVRVGLCETC